MIDVAGLIMDMDGVLWRGDQGLPGLRAFFNTLHRREIRFCLATNNSSRTIDYFVGKLAGMGVEVEANQIISSAYATADYLLAEMGPDCAVHVVGQDGVVDALTSRGFRLTENGADCVVVGIDRQFSYQKLRAASALIQRGARFIGTNGDLTFPTPEGPAPGAGAILAAISAASGVEPTIIGKPEPLMFQLALERMGTDPERTLMVGDRLETDILGGQRAGLGTILVLSGVTDRTVLAGSSIQPDWVLDDISALVEILEA